MNAEKPFVLAIDGYSSTGKSTVAKSIARNFGFLYVDSGAMYRAVTLFAMRNKCFSEGQLDIPKLESLLPLIDITFRFSAEDEKNETFLNGENVEEEIRTMAVASNVSAVSKIKSVRNKLVALQRIIGENQSIAMDGRDIGTVVFPNADLKIFMTASAQVRAQRRYDELVAKGDTVGFDEILANVTGRDREDENRAESPLRQAEDALLLDNSTMSREEQLEWIGKRIKYLRP